MTFAAQLKFADLAKLLENVSSESKPSKREEYFRDYFEKLMKFRDEFRSKQPNQVSVTQNCEII